MWMAVKWILNYGIQQVNILQDQSCSPPPTTFCKKGQEMYDRLRILAYPDADAILIAYDIGDPQTLANVPEKVE